MEKKEEKKDEKKEYDGYLQATSIAGFYAIIKDNEFVGFVRLKEEVEN